MSNKDKGLYYPEWSNSTKHRPTVNLGLLCGSPIPSMYDGPDRGENWPISTRHKDLVTNQPQMKTGSVTTDQHGHFHYIFATPGNQILSYKIAYFDVSNPSETIIPTGKTVHLTQQRKNSFSFLHQYPRTNKPKIIFAEE